jgi:hypothetical protein
MKVISKAITRGVTTLSPKRNLIPRFERRGAARKQGADTMRTLSGEIESQEDWNEKSLSLQSSLYSLPILCPIV